jgi:hypothetical protein
MLVAARRRAREFVALAEGDASWFYWYGCGSDAALQVVKRISPLDAALRTQVYAEPQRILDALDRLRQA